MEALCVSCQVQGGGREGGGSSRFNQTSRSFGWYFFGHRCLRTSSLKEAGERPTTRTVRRKPDWDGLDAWTQWGEEEEAEAGDVRWCLVVVVAVEAWVVPLTAAVVAPCVYGVPLCAYC